VAHCFHLRWQWLWLATLALACLGTLLLPGHASLAQDLSRCHAPPGAAHWLGTDLLGRDLLLRLLFGTRLSLAVGIGATALAIALGTALGTLAGYCGGAVERLAMRLVDVLYALPLTLLVLLLCAVVGRGFAVLCLAIASLEWLTLARVVRTQTADLRRRTFVRAAIAMGQSHRAVIGLHILPNLLPLLGRYALVLLPNAILMESFLGFLGLGIPPPQSSWGNLLVEAIPHMQRHPLSLLLPVLCLFLTLLALVSLRREPPQ
jgi:oligopeptide transport system permease protein